MVRARIVALTCRPVSTNPFSKPANATGSVGRVLSSTPWAADSKKLRHQPEHCLDHTGGFLAGRSGRLGAYFAG